MNRLLLSRSVIAVLIGLLATTMVAIGQSPSCAFCGRSGCHNECVNGGNSGGGRTDDDTDQRSAAQKRRDEEERRRQEAAERQRREEEARRQRELQEQRRREEEARQRQLEEERRREEEARRLRALEEQRRQAEIRRQQIFQNEKTALLQLFQVPAAEAEPPPPVETVGYVPSPDSAPTPAAREYLGCLALLRGKELEKLPADQRRILQDSLAARRNRLWVDAVRDPAVPEDERQWLRLPLPIDRGADTPRAKLRIAPYRPPPPDEERRRDEQVNNWAAEWLANAGSDLIEFGGSEYADYAFGEASGGRVENLVGFAKIAMAATESKAKGAAATVDFIIGSLRIPQAQMAVTGGRMYADVAFAALDKFMRDSTAAVGGNPDEAFDWKAFKESLNTSVQSVYEWIEFGPKEK